MASASFIIIIARQQYTGRGMSAKGTWGIGRGCPFCGHREKTKQGWRFFRDPGTHATQVECKHCGARGPLGIPSEEKALAAWNERQGEGGLLQQRRLTTQH
jgi:Lar family restriction alleviation protein